MTPKPDKDKFVSRVLTFKFVDGIQMCEYPNRKVLSMFKVSRRLKLTFSMWFEFVSSYNMVEACQRRYINAIYLLMAFSERG